MAFETKKEVLDWYEKQPGTLTKEFIECIAWKDVGNYPLNEKLVPVLLYMRDVEALTDMYYEELRRTPTGREPIISKFMERWSGEGGLDWIDKNVSQRIQNLPGFQGLTKVSDKIGEIVSQKTSIV
jgi:hypothetical protein